MKLIQDKKLFGKITIFDIIIVLLFICVAIFAYRYLYSSTGSKLGNTYFTTTCSVRLDNLPIGTFDRIAKDDMIYDNETNLFVGKVVSAEKQEYTKVIEDYENNKFVQAVIPDRETVILNVEVSVYDAGCDLITANNYYVKVGKELFLRGPSYAGGGYVITIDR